MPIAIQEDLLSGSSVIEKFQHAQALGADGVEFWGTGLAARVPEIVLAMQQTGLRTSAINHGQQGGLIDPDSGERDRALTNLRQSIANAVDLDAAGVIFVPHYGSPVLPDLSPWMSAAELEVEMLYMHLRTLSDFSYALGTNLYIEPINHHETHLLNRLEQAARITRRLNHPRVQIAADLFHMALEETDIPAALRSHADAIGYIHLADSNRRLPGEGSTDFKAAAAALKDMGYTGWISYQSLDADHDRLTVSLAHVRKAGVT